MLLPVAAPAGRVGALTCDPGDGDFGEVTKRTSPLREDEMARTGAFYALRPEPVEGETGAGARIRQGVE